MKVIITNNEKFKKILTAKTAGNAEGLKSIASAVKPLPPRSRR